MIEAVNPFTLTKGYSKIVKTLEVKIPDNFEGIKSLHEFIRKYTKKDGELNGKYKKWLSFLISLHTSLVGNYSNKVDPIEYLYFLYSEDYEGLSVSDIHKRVSSFGDYKMDDTLRKFLKDILGWNLRDPNERTEINIKKSRVSKNTTGFKNKILEAQQNFNKKLLELLEGNVNKNKFSKIKYENFKHKKEKNIYLISRLLGIKKNQVNYYIESLKQVCGDKTIAEGLTKLAGEKGINIILTKDDIRNMLN